MSATHNATRNRGLLVAAIVSAFACFILGGVLLYIVVTSHGDKADWQVMIANNFVVSFLDSLLRSTAVWVR